MSLFTDLKTLQEPCEAGPGCRCCSEAVANLQAAIRELESRRAADGVIKDPGMVSLSYDLLRALGQRDELQRECANLDTRLSDALSARDALSFEVGELRNKLSSADAITMSQAGTIERQQAELREVYESNKNLTKELLQFRQHAAMVKDTTDEEKEILRLSHELERANEQIAAQRTQFQNAMRRGDEHLKSFRGAIAAVRQCVDTCDLL